jgi:hypothetical protein
LLSDGLPHEKIEEEEEKSGKIMEGPKNQVIHSR